MLMPMMKDLTVIPMRAVSRNPGIILLRVGVAALLVIHGVSRFTGGGVPGFAEFLKSQHIPLPGVTAWVLTIVEMVGMPLLALGFFVIPIALWMAVELSVGIALVHAQNGWFVVGGGLNGVEYSVLLLIALTAIIVSEWKTRRET
jgi:putative oxidoreductase